MQRIVRASTRPARSGSTPNRRSGPSSRWQTSSISVTLVVSVTSAAMATVSSRLPQTMTARSGPAKMTWKIAMNSRNQRIGQSCCQTTLAGIRASAKPPASTTAATASCHGAVSRTTPMIASSMPSSFQPAGIRCSTEDPAWYRPITVMPAVRRKWPSREQPGVGLDGLRRGAVRDDPAGVQHHHPVESGEQVQVMGDEDDLLVEPGQQVVDHPGVAQIEQRRRFVGDDTSGPVISTAASASSCFCPPDSRWVG